MVMNPRTHPKGAPPDFTLPKPNPNPSRMTDALWWLVCMREALEPKLSQNGGTYADKPGSHNVGSNLRDYGVGDPRTDHSIRDAKNRQGQWKTKCAAHDWTFVDAQKGDYDTITKYTNRLIRSMRDPADPRPDDVYFYTLGQTDNDKAVEGYNERDNESETSSDVSHNWHRHDSFWRGIVGDFWAMWKALTIDMGWSVADWQRSLPRPPEVKMITIGGELPVLKRGMSDPVDKSGTYWVTRAQRQLQVQDDGDYGKVTAEAVQKLMANAPANRSSNDGSIIGEPEWRRLYGLW